MKKNLLAVIGVAILLIVGGIGSATAATLITSHQIQNGTIRVADLRPGAVDRLSGSDGDVTTIVGAGYNSVWKAGEFGETIETCPAGQTAIGGGYSTFGGYGTHPGYDLGGENTDIQVTVSAPYFAGEYQPIDEAGNFRADQWVVRGKNTGTTDQVVRAWVVCAPLAG